MSAKSQFAEAGTGAANLLRKIGGASKKSNPDATEASAAEISAAPTAAMKLKQARSKAAVLAQASSDAMEKIAKLAPLEAAVAHARAELQRVEQSDADALRVWVEQGGNGEPPAANASARESAARELASAEAQLRACAPIKGNLEAEIIASNTQLRNFQSVLRSAEVEVLGEGVLRALEDMREATLALVETEACYIAVYGYMQNIRDTEAGGPYGVMASPAFNAVFNEVLNRINDSAKLTDEERERATRAGNVKAQRVIEQLLADEDPKEGSVT